ncbi:MAG: hypothetical protein IPP94_18030 [Ignavibacteria bacterium]|nr:hypothetical protein [Ignavibacteria bacterium]
MNDTTPYLSELLLRLHGIDISKYEDSFLHNALLKGATESRCASVEEYGVLLKERRSAADLFLQYLNIQYSEFLRNTLTFSVLEGIILPSLLSKIKAGKRKELRIWCAACAAGQEAYSLAMLLEERRPGDPDAPSYRIFATDQSDTVIEEALLGRYSAGEIQNVSMKRVAAWFTEQGGVYIVREELRANIQFSVFDLFSEQSRFPPESIYGDFDLVFCANLLYYYKREYRQVILDKVRSAIARGGYLVTGETEREILLQNAHVEVIPQSAIFRV